ncbi:hypothetical protein M758_3G119400 [Ceratodon purpureus]|uniref:Uncharacterized protein n=1 Tax=Ceratodon purpureus TaxID=3225 RepID=A0A8T0IK44_CERPU|nr:hypothetical protein KC19_3G117800 [Ceratodon purpureus]KAG0622733.1 hypothetical protein M758_3G119400 [Ceratodon purpureus]
MTCFIFLFYIKVLSRLLDPCGEMVFRLWVSVLLRIWNQSRVADFGDSGVTDYFRV